MATEKKFKKGLCNIPTEGFWVFGVTISEIGRQNLAPQEPPSNPSQNNPIINNRVYLKVPLGR